MNQQTYFISLLDTWAEVEGMTPNEIKAQILLMGLSDKELAAEFGVSEVKLSQVINGHRIYPELRKRLARKLRRKVTEVFGKHHPQATKRRQLQPEAV